MRSRQTFSNHAHNQPGSIRLSIGLCASAAALCSCTSTPLNSALGTPKNPVPIYASPYNDKKPNDQSIFIRSHFGVLMEAIERQGDYYRVKPVPNGFDMRRYLAAGFSLGDIYCSNYFTKTDEASRRRRFGRTLTNDVGTAISTTMGLAGAGETAVAALAAATGLADSAWRNYDDSFIISPDLATVRSLVHAAQDNFRARTLGKQAELPADFGTAHSTIRRYAELCSHLGMKALLEQSASKQQSTLVDETENLNGKKASETGIRVDVSAGAATQTLPSTSMERPATALPALTPNSPSPQQ